MKLALYLPNFRDKVTVKELEDLTSLAEDLDFDSVWTLDRIVVPEAQAEEAIEAANDASRQHPCRIIALISGEKNGASRLDAQIRVGGDAGASEVVVLRLFGALADHGDAVLIPLLLPDSPVVAWWPKDAPLNVAESAIGQMAQRRITDAAEASDPGAEMKRRADHYQPGDTDLAWTRITLWRGLLAAALDQPPYEPVLHADVAGASDSPSADLMAGWLAQALQCPVTRTCTPPGTGVTCVRLTRPSGDTDLFRPDGAVATLSPPGQPVRRISLARRELAECLAGIRRVSSGKIKITHGSSNGRFNGRTIV